MGGVEYRVCKASTYDAAEIALCDVELATTPALLPEAVQFAPRTAKPCKAARSIAAAVARRT